MDIEGVHSSHQIDMKKVLHPAMCSCEIKKSKIREVVVSLYDSSSRKVLVLI
jgi:hypothetical protein